MNVRPIRSEPDYEEALAEIERLFDAVPGTPEGDRLDVLITLVEAYEAEHYPILMEGDELESREYRRPACRRGATGCSGRDGRRLDGRKPPRPEDRRGD